MIELTLRYTTNGNGKQVYVNPDEISEVTDTGVGTSVRMKNGSSYVVKESPKMIIAMREVAGQLNKTAKA